MQACGVCHTDLHYREGGINDDFPFLLGHEAAGVVESVGDGVTNVAPGDFVILNWRAVCGNCRSVPARPSRGYCFSTFNATQKMTLTDGTVLSPALGHRRVRREDAGRRRASAPRSTRQAPADRRRPARLRCDGRASVRRSTPATSAAGDSVAVFGCGGVGDAAIAGARLAGARTIVAVDIDDRKLEWAKEFGATHTCNSGRAPTRSSTSSRSPAATVPTCASRPIGNPAVYRQAFDARDLAGTVVLVGVPTPDMTLELPFIEVFGRGGALKSSWYGDCLPSRDFPMLIDLAPAGPRSTSTSSSARRSRSMHVEEAFHKMERGEVLRSVVVTVTVADRTGHHRRHLRARRRRVGGHQQHLAGRRRPRGRRLRRRPRRRPIVAAVNGRRVRAIVLTHGHNDHINAAVPLRDAVDAPVLLHDADRMLWDVVWLARRPTAVTPGELAERSPATSSACSTRPATRRDAAASTTSQSAWCSAATRLFCGGPGATGRSYSDEPTILHSIRDVLLAAARSRPDRAHRPRRQPPPSVPNSRRRSRPAPPALGL